MCARKSTSKYGQKIKRTDEFNKSQVRVLKIYIFLSKSR